MTVSRRGIGWLTVALLVAILGMALWFRWTYVRGVSLYVDEYITLRAAWQILERGVPLLPTGNFYSHGLLLSYVEAGVAALVGFDPLAARLPVLLISVLTVFLVWWVGRRWFSQPVGLLAAGLLALAPEAIVWGGRARMYAPLQFFVLLAVFAYWRAVGAGGRRRDSLFFALCFLCALFLHAEAMILLPVLGLVALGIDGPRLRREGLAGLLRFWWGKGLILAWGAAALGVLVELWFRQLGPPMVSRLAEGVYGPSGRVYVQPAWDGPGIYKTLEPLLTSPGVLGLLALGALLWLFALLGRRRDGVAGSPRHPECGQGSAPGSSRHPRVCGGPHLARGAHRPGDNRTLPEGWAPVLIYLAALVGLTLIVLLFVADSSWKSPRYLFMLLPEVFLILSAGLWVAADRLFRSIRGQWVVFGVALAWVVASSWLPAQAAAREDVAAYDRAFEFVAARWQAGDAVMTFVPQAAGLYLGQSDYVSVPTDYRGFAYKSDGRWLEGWDGIPLVDSAAGVREALAAHDRLWFVVDEHRLHSRFAPGFAQAVWDGMELVWRDGGVIVFASADPPPPTARIDRPVDLGTIRLVGYALERAPQPGQDLPIALFWSADENPASVYSAFVHLVDETGRGWAQSDGPPLGALYPTTSWRPGEVLRDRHTLALPSDLPDGLYRLDAGMYEAETMTHLLTPWGSDRAALGFFRIGAPPGLPADLMEVDRLLESITLLGYSLQPMAERRWALTLAWQAESPVTEDYSVFVHLVDGAGEIAAQRDAPPGGGFYPTRYWTPDEMVLDHHELELPPAAHGGVYRLLVGLYHPESGRRLTAADGQDRLELQTWTIP